MAARFELRPSSVEVGLRVVGLQVVEDNLVAAAVVVVERSMVERQL